LLSLQLLLLRRVVNCVGILVEFLVFLLLLRVSLKWRCISRSRCSRLDQEFLVLSLLLSRGLLILPSLLLCACKRSEKWNS
jgi:hypothetical protein